MFEKGCNQSKSAKNQNLAKSWRKPIFVQVSGSQKNPEHYIIFILTGKRNDKARRMYRRMKMPRSKTDACHLWALFCEWNFVAGFAKRLRRQLDLLTQFLLSYFVARETIRLYRGNPKLETSWDSCPTFWSPVFEVLFFPVLVRAKAIEETCGAACHHVARFLHALACYITTQQFHETRSLLCGAVWPLSHELYAADNRMCILRTMFFCIQGQSWHVHSYEGTCADGSALDILKLHWESIRPLLKTFWTRSRLFLHYRIRNQFLAGRWAIFTRIHDAKTSKNHVTFERFITVSFF